ncbi:hypothetical protein GCM10007176_21490 [Salinicoccus roseus]|nr:hypothetical protein GCM10007176_21490 [Salinicoccus roseus]
MERDREVNAYYHEKGWHIMRMWEHEFKEDFKGAIDRMTAFIEMAKAETMRGKK